jgi:hypothetical protein
MTNTLTNWCDRCQRRFMGFHECSAFVPVELKHPPATLSPEEAPAAKESAGGTYRYRDAEKWRAYMRDYMRKRRGRG